MEGFPSGLASVDLEACSVTMTADASVYPMDAVYGAAFVFIARCYVLLDQPDPGHFSITLSPKSSAGVEVAQLRELVGEFANELLACAWRGALTQSNRVLIENVATQAFTGAMGAPSLDELEAFDFSDEAFEDPLGIATSWEEKYKGGKSKSKGEEKGTGNGGGEVSDEGA